MLLKKMFLALEAMLYVCVRGVIDVVFFVCIIIIIIIIFV